jgi:hypothetical protein
MAATAILKITEILVFSYSSSDFDVISYTTEEKHAESTKQKSGSVPVFSKVATTAFSIIIELLVTNIELLSHLSPDFD